MKLLITEPEKSNNAYIRELYMFFPSNVLITFSATALFEEADTGHYDIIHFHWPDHFYWFKQTNNILDEEVNLIEKSIIKWKKKGAKLIYTIHNFAPHLKKSGATDRLYETIRKYCNAFVHLGRTGKTKFLNMYPELLHREHVVVPHMVYESYPNTITRDDARKYFGFKDNDKVILVFGRIRKKKEKELILKAFNTLDLRNKKLLASRMYLDHHRFSSKLLNKIYVRLQPVINYLRKNCYFNYSFVEDQFIQYYFKAADVVSVPRIDGINSGIPFLAYAFGKVCVAPEIGNIKECLDSVGDPTFIAEDEKSLENALLEGIQLAETNKGKKNKEKASSIYSAKKINDLLYNFYLQLCAK